MIRVLRELKKYKENCRWFKIVRSFEIHKHSIILIAIHTYFQTLDKILKILFYFSTGCNFSTNCKWDNMALSNTSKNAFSFRPTFFSFEIFYCIRNTFLFLFSLLQKKNIQYPHKRTKSQKFYFYKDLNRKMWIKLYCGKYCRNLHLIQIVMKIVFWGKRRKTFSPCFNLIVIRERKSQTKLQTNILK